MMNPFYKKRNIFVFVALALVFLTFFALFGVVETNDSWAFLETNPAVSPLYPLCVKAFVSLFGEKTGLYILVLLQDLLAAYAIFSVTVSLTERFHLGMGTEILVAGIFAGSYVLRLVLVGKEALYCNTIMSEALAYPFFFLFLKYAFFALDRLDYKHLLAAVFFSFLMALTRGQLINTAIVFVVLFFVIHRKRKEHSISEGEHVCVKVTVVMLLYGVGIWLISCLFHLVSSGSFLPTTMGNEAVLGNVLYNSQVSDAECLPEENHVRNIYIETMEKAESDYITVLSAPSGFVDRFKHYEQSHDTVRDYLSETLKEYNPKLDEESIHYAVGEFSKSALLPLLKKNLVPYLKNCAVNMMGGVVRSNSIMSSLGILFSGVVYFIACLFLLVCKKRNILSGERNLLGLILFMIVINCAFCSFGVFELSRYVYYNFPCLYAALLICLAGMVSLQKKTKENID